MPDIMSDPFMAEPAANLVGQAQLTEGLGSGAEDSWTNYTDEEIRNFVAEAGKNAPPPEAMGYRTNLEAEARRRGIPLDALQ